MWAVGLSRQRHSHASNLSPSGGRSATEWFRLKDRSSKLENKIQEKVDLKVLGINKSCTYFKAYSHLCGVLLLLRIIKLETPEGIISFRNLSKVPVAGVGCGTV